MISDALKNKKRCIPSKGYNLVGLDDYEMPGSQLFVIANLPTERSALVAQKAYKAKHPDTETYIYSSEDA